MFFKKRQPKTGKTLACTSCGNSFWLTSIELLFYLTREIDSPTMCRACLRASRMNAGEATMQPHTACRVANAK